VTVVLRYLDQAPMQSLRRLCTHKHMNTLTFYEKKTKYSILILISDFHAIHRHTHFRQLKKIRATVSNLTNM